MERASRYLTPLVLLCGLVAPQQAARAQDVDPPVIEILEAGAPLAEGALFNRSVAPAVTVTDASPTTVDATLDGAPFVSGATVSGEGAHELSVTATDDAGNLASLTRTFEIDTIPPVFAELLPVSGTLTSVAEATLQGRAIGASSVTVDGQPVSLVGEDFTAGPYALAEGERTWTLVAADAAGNTAQLVHRMVRDSTPPTVSIGQPASGVPQKASPIDVVGTASDPRLESVTVNGTAAGLTGSTFLARNVPVAEGATQLVAEAQDAAGNVAQATRTVVLDTQAPALAVTDPAAGTVLPAATLTVRGTASDPHLDRVEVGGVAAQLTAGAWSASASLAEGPNTIEVRAFDRLGWSTAASVTVIRDSTAPAIAIASPAEGAYLQGDSVEVRGTVVHENGLTVTVNGVAAGVDTATNPATFVAPAVALTEGENRLIARVTDSLGNQGAHSRIVYRDTVAPALIRAEPGDGAFAVPPESRFELTFSEPLGTLAAGAWRLEQADGQALAAQATADGPTLVVQPDAPLPSKTEVHLVLTTGIVDRAGNALSQPPTLVFVTRDVVAPDSPVLAAQPPGYLCASAIALSGSAEAEAVVTVTGGAAGASTRAGADGSFSLAVELRPGGRNRLELTAVDLDGNPSEPLVVEVVQDCVSPRVVAAELASGAVTITFDEPVDPATVPGAVTVTTATGPVAGAVSVAPDGTAASFTPADPLPAEVIRLEVGQAVRDLAGNPLAFPYTELFGASVTQSFVAGRILDSATGRPLAGATVVVDATDGVVHPAPQPEQTTGADGRFRVPVAPGTHFLLILRPGYTPAFRIVASPSGQGADVFDPRLTAAAPAATVPAAGGTYAGSDGLALELPAGALAADAEVAVTALDEQALPALLPFGWSPRGAAWVDLGGADLAAPASLTLPVAAPNGTSLAVVRLDLGTLQWHVAAVEQALGGTVSIPVSGEGAYAAVEADLGTLAPPAPVAGTVLGSAPAPVGDEVTAAAVEFDPEVVLPSQTSRVTVTYTLAAEAPSGLALTVVVAEELTLLDGTVRRQPPYESDLVLYRSPAGAPRSELDLQPSPLARSLAFEVGAEDVTVRPYAGQTVQGNVLGPPGGTVATPEGDRVDLPAGALSEPTAVLLHRLPPAELPGGMPAGTELLGLLELDLSGRALAAPAALTLELGAAPAPGEVGLLFEVLTSIPGAGSGPFFRPVAALAATASGWTTAPIDPADLPWPGVREAGRYAFGRLTSPVGYLRGTVFGVSGVPLSDALVTAASGGGAVPWVQLSTQPAAGAGSYVLPVPVAAVTALAQDLASGDRGSAAATVAAVDERVDLDLFLQLTGPQVVEVQPADGALEVPPGIEPTVTFSEPVDPATVPAGVLLYDGATAVPAAIEVQGALVRLRPQATLRPGTLHEIRVNTAVRDLQGNRVAAAVVSTFTTRDDQANDQLDLTRVHLFEPDTAGMARVLGRPGAVPAGTLVFIENLSRLVSTPSVTAAADGGFETEIEAALSDRLLLHAVIEGQNEVVIELTPFLTADGRGAHVDDEAATAFTTLDGITISVEAGTFTRPTLVRATPRPLDASPAPAPEGVISLLAFELDFGGAEAAKPIQVSVPAPTGTPSLPEGSTERLMLARTERILGEHYWMVYDLLRQVGATLTTEPPSEELAAAGARFRVPTGSGEIVARLAALGAPGAGSLSGLGSAVLPSALEPLPAPSSLGDQKEYLPGSVNPGLYQVMYTNHLYDFVAIPFAGTYGFFQAVGVDGIVAIVNAKIERLLEHDAILMPTRRGETVSIVGRDLTTGYRFFEGSFGPPAEGEVLILPPDIFGDAEEPFPVTGSPLRFFVLDAAAAGVRDLAVGIEQEVITGAGDQATLTVRGDLGAGQPDVQLRLLGLDDAVDVTARSQGPGGQSPGAFELSTSATRGHRYLLAVGAVIPSGRAFQIGFSEGLDPALTGIEVRDSAGRNVRPEIAFAGTNEVVRVSPRPGWRVGTTYTLRLGPGLADGAGNAWGETLAIEFRVQASEIRDTYGLGAVRDIARLGSLLFLAADTDGLVVLDASDPASLEGYVTGAGGDLHFPFQYGDPVRGVTVDPHGRVLVVGGGVQAPGMLKILDPLAIDPAAFAADPAARFGAYKGSTILSDKMGGVGTHLPSGTPRRVAVLSDDQRDGWRIGVDPPPAGVELMPVTPPPAGGEYELTVSGTGWQQTANRPVTLRNLTRGRWRRVSTDPAGAFSLSLTVAAGDTLELLRNRQSLAYVVTLGVGLEVVDVNAFWNESPEEPNDVQSDVLGIYTGYQDPSLRLCNEAVADIGSAILDLGALLGPEPGHPHPLTIVSLFGFRGIGLFESDPADVGEISFYGDVCLEVEGSARVSGLEVLEDYRFDLDGDGVLEADEERDYLLVAHLTKGVLILDATDRDHVELAGRVRLPGQAVHLGVDREGRRLYVAAGGAGIYVVDLDAVPTNQLLDADGDGQDDRVLEHIDLGNSGTNAPILLVPELGLAYAGSLDRGLTSVAVGEPRLVAVAENEAQGAGGALTAGRWREVRRLAPFGVPTAPESAVEGAPELPGAFRVLAHLPGVSGPEVRLDVVGLGPGGLEIAGAGGSDLGGAAVPDLPPSALSGSDGLVLRRLSDDPLDEGFQIYLSEEVAVVADLRAASAFERTAREDDRCERCDLPEDAREVLSGHSIAIRFPDTLRAALGSVYGAARLDGAELELQSVPWETSPSTRQEPTLNPSYGAGDAAPGTLLHSGEYSHEATDLAVRSRGFDFAFSRTYRNQTVGAGPLGPGWDLGYRQRLRELPSGDVEYYDGRGRRELFRKTSGEEGAYEAPAGRFVELFRTAAGWVWIDSHRNQMRFDRFGRLTAVADAVNDSAETGNEMRFRYDAAGRLVEIEDTLERSYRLEYDEESRLIRLTDFDGREVAYEYDAAGRLARVLSPEVTTGLASPGRLPTTYTYETGAGTLAATLTGRDDLASITDPRGVEWLTLTHSDADGDGRSDEVTGQTWGGDALSIGYDFTGRTATVTDRRGQPWAYQHDGDGHPTRLTDPTDAATVLAYDAEGLLTSRTEPLGRVTTYAYDTSGGRRSRGNVTELRVTPGAGGPNGSAEALVTTIVYEAGTNQPTTLTDPRGGTTTYTRNAAGLPTTIARPEGATSQLEYNDYGQVTRVENPNGRATTYAYFTSGEAEGYLRQEVVDPGGLALTSRYEPDARGNVTAVIDPRGTRHTSRFNELDWTVEETAAAGSLGYTTTYAYDEAGQVTETREPYGLGTEMAATRTTYGPLGEVLGVERDIEPTGTVATSTYEYDANRNALRVTDPNGHVTATAYDARNLPTSRTMGEGTAEAATETFAYDAEGRLVARTDGRGNDWTREYDGYGRLAAAGDPLGNRTETLYDNGGNATETRALATGGGLLAKTSATYDLLGRATTQTRHLWSEDPGTAGAVTTTTTYDPAGNVLSVTDPLGRVTSYAYDAAERPLSSTDPVGNEIAFQLNATGQPEAVTLTEAVSGGGSAAATTTTHEYDALGRETAAIDPLGNTTRRIFDAQGHARLETDPEGYSTERAYDSRGRLLSETLPEGIRVEMTYDGNGHRTGYQDALGNTTTWSYDGLDRLQAVAYPDGTTESYSYDAAGNPTQITQPSGTTVAQTYDAGNRLVGRTISRAAGVEGPASESFQYDGLGRLTQATSGSGSGAVSSTRTYDSHSRLTSESTAGKTVTYQLDGAGNVTGITYPSGVTVSRQVDDLDRLEEIPGVAAYGYRGPDLVAQKAAGALSGTTSYDPARRPTSRTAAAGPRVVYDETMSWSPRSLLTGHSRLAQNETAFQMVQDGAGRLESRAHVATLTAGSGADSDGYHAFGYDPAQNLVQQQRVSTEDPLTVTPTPVGTQNRPSSIGGVPLLWDANGNLTAKGDLRFHYDWRNRLSRVTRNDGTELASYSYDAFSRLLSRTAGGTTETTAWSGWQPVEAYRGGQLRQRRTFGLGLDEIVRLEVDLDEDGVLEQSYTPLFDQPGNLVAVAGPSGDIIERYEYSPYGFRVAAVDSIPPEILQLLFRSDGFQVDLSEQVLRRALAPQAAAPSSVTSGEHAAITAGSTAPPPVSLTVTATGGAIPVTVSFPVELGRFAFRRAVITSSEAAPEAGTEVTLRVEAAGLQDLFFNEPAAAFEQTFLWPAGEEVLLDAAAPRVEEVVTRGGYLEIAFSEEVDLASAQTAILIDGAPVAWELDDTGYRLRTVDPLEAGTLTLTIGTGVQDLAGTALPSALAVDLTAPIATADPVVVPQASAAGSDLEPRVAGLASPDSVFFRIAEAGRLLTSSIDNGFGFHGREIDFATGLVYFRNRWYDPELGRFLQQDPMGYVDGPNLYAYALNNPASYSDPLGLEAGWIIARTNQRLEESGIDPYLFGRASPEEAAFIVRNVENYGLWWEFVGLETLSLPNRAGQALFDLGPTLWRGAKGFSDLGQKGLICASDPGDCLGGFGETLRGLPETARAGWNAWANRPAEIHIREWARATVDTAAAVQAARLPKLQAAPRPGVVPRAGAGLSDDVLRLAEQNLTNTGNTVLGSYPGYKNKANARGASFFDIGNAWEALTPAQRTAANNHFLDVIAARGDRVLLSVQKSQIQQGTALADEVAYLTGQKGYVWVNQWSLRPGG